MQTLTLEQQTLAIWLANHPGCRMPANEALRSLEAAGFVRRDDEEKVWLTYAGCEIAGWLRLAKERV